MPMLIQSKYLHSRLLAWSINIQIFVQNDNDHYLVCTYYGYNKKFELAMRATKQSGSTVTFKQINIFLVC